MLDQKKPQFWVYRFRSKCIQTLIIALVITILLLLFKRFRRNCCKILFVNDKLWGALGLGAWVCKNCDKIIFFKNQMFLWKKILAITFITGRSQLKKFASGVFRQIDKMTIKIEMFCFFLKLKVCWKIFLEQKYFVLYVSIVVVKWKIWKKNRV